jgi:hypothetical protein
VAHRYPNIIRTNLARLDDGPNERLSQAIAERDRFLERHPQYRPMQQQIDNLLEKAGTPENRMSVLALLMESKLMELHVRLQNLNRVLLSVHDR